MGLLPAEAKKIEVAGATVDFFTYIKDGLSVYQFDTSMCGPPDPMVNAMAGLRMIDASDKKLIMINHKAPGGLFGKIGENFDYMVEDLADGNVKVVFSYKTGESEKADLTQTSCGG
ncbi:MAG: hypothetical protein U9Q62_08735 [Campylobacterota bacterium]|nr:hypothetical protein [Campylobacterota bacterium]